MTFEEYAQKHLGDAGYSFSAMELVRMGWNARGSYGNSQGILDGSSVTVSMLPFAKRKAECIGDLCGVIVLNDARAAAAVTDVGRVIWLDDCESGPADHIADTSKMVEAGAQGAEPVANDGPLPCPFCGDKPEWVKEDDPSWPQVECKNLECPISHSDWISLDAWNRRAYTQPQSAGVPDEWRKTLERIARYPLTRSEELSATAMRKMARESLSNLYPHLSDSPTTPQPRGR